MSVELSANTRRAYAGDWRQCVAWLAAHKLTPETATAADVALWAAQLAETCAPATVARKLAAVRRCWPDRAAARGLRWTSTFTDGHRRARTAERQPAADVAAMLAKIDLRTAAGARDAALLALVCGAGLWASEASRLTVADVDLRAGVVQVGVNGRARFVPLPEPAQTALARWLVVRRAVGAQNGALFVGLHRAGTGAALGETGVRWVVRKWTGAAQDGQDDQDAAARR